jgi:peptide-methionine (S)-S-oxide reductase
MNQPKWKIKLLIGSLFLSMSMTETTWPEKPGNSGSKHEILTLGGGCFWCIEAVFDMVRGVSSVESGYSGGRTANPTYQEVCSGETGHAEVVQIHFDPLVISSRELLEMFFILHDPTQLNRQGPDVGTQYRSVIFYRTPEQKSAAEQVIREMEEKKAYQGKIVTQVVPFSLFYRAENYHQEYYQMNGMQPYCRAIIAPKVAKFRKLFHDRLK